MGLQGLNTFYIPLYPENPVFCTVLCPHPASPKTFQNAPDTGWHVSSPQPCAAKAPVWHTGMDTWCRQRLLGKACTGDGHVFCALIEHDSQETQSQSLQKTPALADKSERRTQTFLFQSATEQQEFVFLENKRKPLWAFLFQRRMTVQSRDFNYRS